MDLEGIMLSEISQTEKDKYHMISPSVESKEQYKRTEIEIDSETQRRDWCWPEGRRRGAEWKRIEKCRLAVTNQSRVREAEHRE